MSTRILALVGSLRAGSYNRQLAEAAVKHAPDGTDVEIFEGLDGVPFYNEDLDRPGMFAFNAAVLLAGFRLTGLAWSELCFLVLPPMKAGSGAVLTFFALNRMALRPEVAAADSLPGYAHVALDR